MTDIRMLVSWGAADAPPTDRYSNTLYFAHQDPGDPNYQTLANDLRDIYAARSWIQGCVIEVRAYNMADAKPRPERAFAKVTKAGTLGACARQVAICLSYYSDRNLPQQRGRIYTGPWPQSAALVPTAAMTDVMALGAALAGLGGINVDWSVYSPTRATQGDDPTMTISNYWCDNSWDVVRSRKLKATTRQTATTSG